MKNRHQSELRKTSEDEITGYYLSYRLYRHIFFWRALLPAYSSKVEGQGFRRLQEKDQGQPVDGPFPTRPLSGGDPFVLRPFALRESAIDHGYA